MVLLCNALVGENPMKKIRFCQFTECETSGDSHMVSYNRKAGIYLCNKHREQYVSAHGLRHQVCSSCGNNRKVVARDPDGAPLCSTCYHKEQAPKKICSVCNEERVLVKKTPATCGPCYHRARRKSKAYTLPEKTCATCGDVGRLAVSAPPTCARCYRKKKEN